MYIFTGDRYGLGKSAFEEAVMQLDPRSVITTEENLKRDTKIIKISFTTLDMKMSAFHEISYETIMRAVDDMDFSVYGHLLDDICAGIVETYIEYWHLSYEGDMTLDEFTQMTPADLSAYLLSAGEKITGVTYSRACTLQQRRQSYA